MSWEEVQKDRLGPKFEVEAAYLLTLNERNDDDLMRAVETFCNRNQEVSPHQVSKCNASECYFKKIRRHLAGL